METPTLSSERLLYRPVTMDDIDFLFELFSRPETNKYSEYTDVKTKEEAVQIFEHFMKPGGDGLFRVMITSQTGESLGTIGLYDYSTQHKRAEIGFELMKEHWGNGYMTEAARTIMDYGFNTLDLVRIEATVDSENLPSARVLEKLGFKHEGTMKKRFYHDEKWHDELWYGFVKDS